MDPHRFELELEVKTETQTDVCTPKLIDSKCNGQSNPKYPLTDAQVCVRFVIQSRVRRQRAKSLPDSATPLPLPQRPHLLHCRVSQSVRLSPWTHPGDLRKWTWPSPAAEKQQSSACTHTCIHTCAHTCTHTPRPIPIPATPGLSQV